MIVAILLIQAVAFAILSGIVASNKNRDAFGWSVLGFLFGLFGFIAVVAVSEVEKRKSQSLGAQEFDPDKHDKKCPSCAEYIKLEARVCKHCGHEFSEGSVKRQIEERKQEVEQDKNKAEKFFCEHSERVVPRPNPDGTCPACGRDIDDGRHPSS